MKKIPNYDLEYLSRGIGQSCAPRVILPETLEKFGIFLPNLALVYDLMRGGFCGAPSFSVLREKYVKHDPATGKILPTKHGEIVLEISLIDKVGTEPQSPRDMPKLWQSRFNILSKGLIDTFVEAVSPCHLHFILKDSPVFPLPIKYMEFYIKSQNGNMGNIMANYEDGDVAKDSRLVGLGEF